MLGVHKKINVFSTFRWSVKTQDAPNSSLDSGSTLKPSILQLLSGWLGSVRAEESCHKASHDDSDQEFCAGKFGTPKKKRYLSSQKLCLRILYPNISPKKGTMTQNENSWKSIIFQDIC